MIKQHEFEQARDRFQNASRQRQQAALRLRSRGLTYAEIGEQFGVTRQRAFAMTKQALRGVE